MQAAADAAAQVAVDAEEEALSDSEEDEEDPLEMKVVQTEAAQLGANFKAAKPQGTRRGKRTP